MAWTETAEIYGHHGAGGTAMGDSPAHGTGPFPAPSITCDDRPTLLVAGPAIAASELADWGARAGLRCIDTVALDELAMRLSQTVAVDLILADLRGMTLDGASAQALAARHELGSARLAILTDLDGLDMVMARFDQPDADILCAPGRHDIVSLLVMAALDAERCRRGVQLHDTARDQEAKRIEQLSDEVRRLAETIERLTSQNETDGPAGAVMEARHAYRGMNRAEESDTGRRPASQANAGNARTPGPLEPLEIKAMLRARRLRDQFLPPDLFADPAWDMILDLMAARLSGQRVSVSSLCIAAAVPPTTALRWIRQLTDRGVFARIDDPADGRRVFIELTEDAAEAFTGWALAVRRNGGLLPPRDAH